MSKKDREENRLQGRRMAKTASKDYMYGCILYWTEGSKGKYTVDFANADVFMIKYFVEFLRKHFGCKDEDFAIYLNAYLNNGMSLGDIEEYWLNATNLPRTCLRKFTNRAKYYDPENKRKKAKHPYGVCKVRVNSSEIVETIFGSIEEEFGTKIKVLEY